MNRVRVSVRMRGDVPRAAVMGARVIGVAHLASRGTQRLVALRLVRVRVGGRFRFGVRLSVRNRLRLGLGLGEYRLRVRVRSRRAAPAAAQPGSRA